MKDSVVELKVAILAGGEGTRLREETMEKPKAMVEIGRRPILWHIMKYYSHFGFREFIIALGYKGEFIKHWIHENIALNGNMTVRKGEVIFHEKCEPNWIIHLVDTGEKTQTGGRIKRLDHLLDDQTFMLTWCDGVSDVDLHDLLRFHRSHGRLATLTAVRPPSRFGHLILDEDRVVRFKEKPKITDYWINGAFFVLEPGIFDYIEGDDTQWERDSLERLASNGQLMAYRHKGFWLCMDTFKEKLQLQSLWQCGKPPWKKWY